MFNTGSNTSNEKDKGEWDFGPLALFGSLPLWLINGATPAPARHAPKVVGAAKIRRAAPLKLEFMFRFCIARPPQSQEDRDELETEPTGWEPKPLDYYLFTNGCLPIPTME